MKQNPFFHLDLQIKSTKQQTKKQAYWERSTRIKEFFTVWNGSKCFKSVAIDENITASKMLSWLGLVFSGKIKMRECGAKRERGRGKGNTDRAVKGERQWEGNNLKGKNGQMKNGME